MTDRDGTGDGEDVGARSREERLALIEDRCHRHTHGISLHSDKGFEATEVIMMCFLRAVVSYLATVPVDQRDDDCTLWDM